MIKSAIGNQKSAMRRTLSRSSKRTRLPRNVFGFQYRLDSRSLCQRLQPVAGKWHAHLARDSRARWTMVRQCADWTVCAT